MKQRGYSLVELAIVLAVTGVVGVVAWRLPQLLRPSAQGDTIAAELRFAEHSLEGFALTNNRLPCPDTVGDGFEHCNTNSVGAFPFKTVGYAAPQMLRYGVYRAANVVSASDADLAAARDRYTPLLPPSVSAVAQTNGLDLCMGLRNAIAAPAALTAGGVPVAYALASPGNNNVFEGAQATGGFDLPGQGQNSSDDDKVLAAGLAEFASRLGCPTQLDAADGAARAAYASYDLDRYAAEYQSFRTFVVQVRTTALAMSIVHVTLATVDLANAIGTGTSALVLAAESVGIGASTVGPAVAGVIIATTSLGGAVAGTVTAGIALDKANKQKAAADLYKTQTALWATDAANTALTAVAKGLLP